MNRTLLALAAVVVVVGGGAVATGAVDGVFEDADDVEIEDDAVVLQPADSPEGDVYADFVATDSGDNLRVEIDNLNQLATSEVDNVFTATYNGNQDARVHFEDTGSKITIYDMETGDPVETENNAVILTPSNDQRTFGIRITADDSTNQAVLNGVTVVARAVNPEFRVVDIETRQQDVTAGEDVTVQATIENQGDGFPRAITLNAANRENSVASQTVSLDQGESRTVEFGYSTRAVDTGTLRFGVDAVDDTVEPAANGAAVVQVAEPTSEFDVSEFSLGSDAIAAGSTVTATVTVENVGADAGEGTVELLANEGSISERDLTLAVGETTTVELPYVPTRGVAGTNVSIRAQTPTAESNSGTVSVTDPVTFGISDAGIDTDTLELGEDGQAELTVEPTISNDANAGGPTGEARVWLEFGTERIDFATEAIAAGETETVALTAEIDERDLEGAASVDRPVRVFTENDEAGDTVTVQRPAEFDVTVDNVTTETPRDGDVTVDATVANVGGAEGTQTVSLTGAGLADAATDVTLNGGERTTITLTAAVDTAAEPGEVELTIDAGDNEETATTTILQPPTFDLTGAAVRDPVFTDEVFTTEVRIQNVGGENGEETVALLVDGESVDEATVEVVAGSAATATLEYDIEDAGVEPGPLEIALEGSDDTINERAEVRPVPTEPFFRVEGATFTPDVVPQLAGETVTAAATVRNTGNETGTDAVAFAVDGETIATEQVELDSGETADIDFSTAATTLSTGDQTVSITTQDSERTAAVTVREPQPASFETALTNLNAEDTLADGDTVTVEIENTGELNGTAEVELSYETTASRPFARTTTEEAVTVPAGESTTVDLSVNLSDTARAGEFDGEAIVAVRGDDAATASLPVTLEFGTGAGAVEASVETAAETDVSALIGASPDIDGTVTVDEPGVTVRYVGPEPMDPAVSGTAFEVQASDVVLTGVDMVGTDANTGTGIEITDAATDVVVDGARITGSDWARAIAVNGDRTELRYLTVRNTENGIVSTGADLIVRNSQLRGAEQYAIELTSEGADTTASNTTIRDSNFVGNTRGLFADAGSHTMESNNIERNDAAIETIGTESQVFISAPDNWWGSAAGPAVAENPGVTEEEADILSNVEFPSPESAPVDDAIFSIAEPTAGGTPLEVTQGETLSIETTVRNDGGTAGTSNRQTIQLLVGETVVDTQTVDGLGADASATVELSYTPTDISDRTATIRSNEDRVTVDVSVTKPPEPGDGDDGLDGGGDEPGDGSDRTDGGDDDGDARSDGSAGSSGGGGGGVPAGDTPESINGADVITTETEVPRRISGDTPVAAFDTVETVQTITFQTDAQVGDVQVSTIDPDTEAIDTPGVAVAVQDITVPDESADTPATIEFTIPQDRLNEIGATPEALQVFRNVDSGQEPLETTVETSGADMITVTAETPGFSVFSVNAVSEPDAAISVDAGVVETGEEITLSGINSTTEYGEIVAYEWAAGGETLTGETARTAFNEGGEYTIELTVINGAGETDTTTANLTVETGGDGTAGDVRADDGTAGDGAMADGVEQPDGFNWGVVLVIVILAILAVAGVVLARRRS